MTLVACRHPSHDHGAVSPAASRRASKRACWHYIHLYRGDAAALAESLGRIQQAAATILGVINVDETGCEESPRAAA
jgi:hypothetical protein